MSQSELFEKKEPSIGDLERQLAGRDMATIIGVDEAGRGPLAGPVYAAAYMLELRASSLDALQGLDDSKKLDESVRERFYEELTTGDHVYSIASSSAATIDEINVLQATFRAMGQAVEKVIDDCGKKPDIVVVDGNMTIPDGPYRQQAVVKGDRRSLAIAAASVLAKVARDRFMCDADEQWPQYGFASHKGYGTAQHRQALVDYGPCRLHRRSFAGVIQDGEH